MIEFSNLVTLEEACQLAPSSKEDREIIETLLADEVVLMYDVATYKVYGENEFYYADLMKVGF